MPVKDIFSSHQLPPAFWFHSLHLGYQIKWKHSYIESPKMSNTFDLMFNYDGVKVSILQRGTKKLFIVLYILFWLFNYFLVIFFPPSLITTWTDKQIRNHLFQFGRWEKVVLFPISNLFFLISLCLCAWSLIKEPLHELPFDINHGYFKPKFMTSPYNGFLNVERTFPKTV